MDDQQPLAKAQFERNRVTRDDWQSFAPHRTRVTDLLLSRARSDHSTLCILGAGNGNDIDLPLLVDRFAKVTLVDLDGDALDHCVAQQAADVAARIEVIRGTDLSGILTLLEGNSEQLLPIQLTEQVIAQARDRQPPPKLGKYDVVASCCLMTQMIDSVVQRLGADHPLFAGLALAVRDGHLELLCDLTAKSGSGLLITDFVSSDTLPELQAALDQGQLEQLLAQAINQGNFFTGVNPAALAQRLSEDSICSNPRQVQLDPPWRWQMGNRCYGVCAVIMTRVD